MRVRADRSEVSLPVAPKTPSKEGMTMRRQSGLLVVGVCALLAIGVQSAVAKSPAVQLFADPHWNGYTHSTPTFLGTINTTKAPVDASSFVLTVDDRVVYTGGVDWFLYPGSTFHHRSIQGDARAATWEYRQSCEHADVFTEGRHEVRFEFRDTEGNLYGEDTSVAFLVDRTPPVVGFDGFTLVIEDKGSGPYLDPRVERGRLAICMPEYDRSLCEQIAQKAPGWDLDCETRQDTGLKVDFWLLSRNESGFENRFLSTEPVGWPVSTSRSGDRITVDLEPLGKRHHLSPGSVVELTAYSQRLVLSGDAVHRSPPSDLIAYLTEQNLPFVFDQANREITVYLRGPVDHARNALHPVFSKPLDAESGTLAESDGNLEDVSLTSRFGTTEPPPASSSSAARTGAARPQGTAQTSILEITNTLVAPNPFNPFQNNAVISFDLSQPAELEVIAYDWAGEFVDIVYRGSGVSGPNAVDWGGQTEDGRKLGNGMYLIRIVASTQVRTESAVVKAVVWNES
jgi:hypothetical protein